MAFFIFWVICVAISAVLVNKFKRSGWWIFFTMLFPITLLLLLVSGKKEGKGGFKRCPQCEELINYFANICPHCHANQYPDTKKKKTKSIAERAEDVKDQVIITSICPHCKCINSTDTKYCFQCGKELNK